MWGTLLHVAGVAGWLLLSTITAASESHADTTQKKSCWKVRMGKMGILLIPYSSPE